MQILSLSSKHLLNNMENITAKIKPFTVIKNPKQKGFEGAFNFWCYCCRSVVNMCDSAVGQTRYGCRQFRTGNN